MKFKEISIAYENFISSEEIINLTEAKKKSIEEENYQQAFEIQTLIEDKWRDKVKSFEFNK